MPESRPYGAPVSMSRPSTTSIENVHIVSTTHYQPALRNAGDFHALEELTLVIEFTDRLDLKLSPDVVHDSHPPQLVEKTDVTYRTGVEYAF